MEPLCCPVTMNNDVTPLTGYLENKARSAENDFLRRVVGKALRLCLSELVEHLPRDPIEWIACWLYHYCDSTSYYEEKLAFLAEMGNEFLSLKKDREDKKCRVKDLKDAKKLVTRKLQDGSLLSESDDKTWRFQEELPKTRQNSHHRTRRNSQHSHHSSKRSRNSDESKRLDEFSDQGSSSGGDGDDGDSPGSRSKSSPAKTKSKSPGSRRSSDEKEKTLTGRISSPVTGQPLGSSATGQPLGTSVTGQPLGTSATGQPLGTSYTTSETASTQNLASGTTRDMTSTQQGRSGKTGDRLSVQQGRSGKTGDKSSTQHARSSKTGDKSSTQHGRSGKTGDKSSNSGKDPINVNEQFSDDPSGSSRREDLPGGGQGGQDLGYGQDGQGVYGGQGGQRGQDMGQGGQYMGRGGQDLGHGGHGGQDLGHGVHGGQNMGRGGQGGHGGHGGQDMGHGGIGGQNMGRGGQEGQGGHGGHGGHGGQNMGRGGQGGQGGYGGQDMGRGGQEYGAGSEFQTKGGQQDSWNDRSMNNQPNIATWGVTWDFRLVCQHPGLGDIEPRPPLIYPETPEWWGRRGYMPELMYDHELYSRLNDDTHPTWDQVARMSYKEFVQPGPWLAEKILINMEPSLQDLISMPVRFVKHKRRRVDGDYYVATVQPDSTPEPEETPAEAALTATKSPAKRQRASVRPTGAKQPSTKRNRK